MLQLQCSMLTAAVLAHTLSSSITRRLPADCSCCAACSCHSACTLAPAPGASVFPAQGSSVGDSFQLMCPAGTYVTAFTGASGNLVEEVSVMCSDGSKLAPAGGKAAGRPFAFGSAGGFKGVTAVASEAGVEGVCFHSHDKKDDKYIDSPVYGRKGSRESKMSCKDNEKIIGIHGKTWRRGGDYDKHDKHDKHDSKFFGGSPCSSGDCDSYITSFGVICGKPPCSKKGCSFPQPCSGKSRKGKGGCYFNPCSGCPHKYPCAPGCMQPPSPPPSPSPAPVPPPRIAPQEPPKKPPTATPKPPASKETPAQKPQQRGELTVGMRQRPQRHCMHHRKKASS